MRRQKEKQLENLRQWTKDIIRPGSKMKKILIIQRHFFIEKPVDEIKNEQITKSYDQTQQHYIHNEAKRQILHNKMKYNDTTQ